VQDAMAIDFEIAVGFVSDAVTVWSGAPLLNSLGRNLSRAMRVRLTSDSQSRQGAVEALMKLFSFFVSRCFLCSAKAMMGRFVVLCFVFLGLPLLVAAQEGTLLG
jgi:hypothetical protein